MTLCVYKIYPTSQHSRAADLERFCTELNVNALLSHSQYIWHQEPFCVWVEENHLLGKSIVADCVDDEWFIVYILKQLSNSFDVVCSCSDEDGEFLLIEVADLLSKEVEPMTSENRVFIYKGQVHLVPSEVGSAVDAIDLIQQNPKATILSEKIQQAIDKRCDPVILKNQIHKAKVIIPHLAAHALTLYPGLISPAVEAFYSRDPVSSRPIAQMEKFSPKTNVPMTASFTKIRYSQLKCAQLIAPSAFNLPPLNDPQHQAADLGMKLACGFEILFGSLKIDEFADSSQTTSDDFEKNLLEAGYYKPEDGSNSSERLKASAHQILQTQLSRRHIPYLTNVFKKICLEENLMDQSFFSQVSPDPDSWMMIDVEEVDVILDDKVKNLEFSSDSDFLVPLDFLTLV